MDKTIQNNIEQVLVERLALIKRIQQAFKEWEPNMPIRFRRGAMQRELCNEVGIPWIGRNKRLINEAMSGLGYIGIRVNGTRFYRKGDAYGR